MASSTVACSWRSSASISGCPLGNVARSHPQAGEGVAAEAGRVTRSAAKAPPGPARRVLARFCAKGGYFGGCSGRNILPVRGICSRCVSWALPVLFSDAKPVGRHCHLLCLKRRALCNAATPPRPEPEAALEGSGAAATSRCGSCAPRRRSSRIRSSPRPCCRGC